MFLDVHYSGSRETVTPLVDWSQVVGLVQPVNTCFQRHLQHLNLNYVSEVSSHSEHISITVTQIWENGPNCVGYLAPFGEERTV